MDNGLDVDLAKLDLPAEQMQAMGEDVLARIVAHLRGLPEAPICGDFTGIEDLCRSLREGEPESGASI
ncbi:MAG: hypothetical protein KDI69_03200, partial [Xanthomonadales bacterium]|nr:hypothetical protein [Xanthomonadales bacterium]